MHKFVERGTWSINPMDFKIGCKPGDNPTEPDKNEKEGDGFETPYDETGESFGI